jgi:hypothetical protein
MKKALLLLPLAVLTTGCAIVQVKPEGRVASDQLLISLAIEDAVRNLDLKPSVNGKKASLKVVSLGTVTQDVAYVTEAIKIRVSQCGGTVVEEGQAVQLVAFVETVGSDIDESKVAFPMPLPSVTSMELSELEFYRDTKQIARCRLSVHTLDAEGNMLRSHGPVHIAHRVKNPVLFGITLGKGTDVKELNGSKGDIPIRKPGLTK